MARHPGKHGRKSPLERKATKHHDFIGEAAPEREEAQALKQEHLAQGNDLDFSYVSSEGGRFRVNVFRKETGIGATFRSIPAAVPTLNTNPLDTMCPSADNSLPHTPNIAPSEPASGRKKPQSRQIRLVDCAICDRGP